MRNRLPRRKPSTGSVRLRATCIIERAVRPGSDSSNVDFSRREFDHDEDVVGHEPAERGVSLPFTRPPASILIFLTSGRRYFAMIWSLLRSLISAFNTRRSLALENLALRQQLVVLQRSVKRPRLSNVDRCFWVWLRRVWTDCDSVLLIVKPETVVRWHRAGFRRYWTWKSRKRRPGRPGVAPEIRELIRTMSGSNPLWGAPRVHGELMKLGISISQAAVSKYMVRHRKPPSQTWRSFLDNHVKDLVSVNVFTLPTATLRFYSSLSFSVTIVVGSFISTSRTILLQEWTAQQMVEAFPWDSAPRYLLRDRDRIYGRYFNRRVAGLSIRQVLTAPRSPWQSPYVERVVGSIRRECLDHVIVLNERHPTRILREYIDYYHSCRTHLSLEKDAPEPRVVESPEMGRVTAVPKVGGLHHYYTRLAA